MTQPRQIKASVGFKKLSAGDVLARAIAILEGVYQAKDDYPNSPVDQATLKAQIDALSAGITAALVATKPLLQGTPEGSRHQVARSTRTLRRGELQRRHADVPEEWLPAAF